MNFTGLYKSYGDITESRELNQDTSPVDGIDIVINVSFSFVLNTLLCLIFAYLHNLTLAKQCVLLVLYKEFIIVLVLCLCLMNALPIGVYFYGYPLHWVSASIITFCLRIGTAVLLLLANVIHFLKYRMNKEKMLDPPMPWGEDEERGLLWIRVFCWGFAIGFVTTMHLCGIHTAYYHLAIGQSVNQSEPSINSGLNIFLLATCALFVAGEYYHQKNNDGQAFDPVVSRRLKFLVLSFVAAALFASIVNILANTPTTSEQFGIWIRRNIFTNVLIVEIVIAIGTLSMVGQVKSYAMKLMTNIYEQVFFLNIYLVPLFLFIVINGSLFIIYQVFDI